MRHARFGCSLCPSHHDRSPHRPTWRIAFGRCRIRPDQTPASDRESLLPPGAQSPRMRPTDRRLVLAVDPASPSLAISGRIQAIDPVEFPSRSGSAQIQIPVFAKTSNEARTKRSRSAHNSCRCRDEAAQSEMGVSSHCRADQSGLPVHPPGLCPVSSQQRRLRQPHFFGSVPQASSARILSMEVRGIHLCGFNESFFEDLAAANRTGDF